MEEALADQGDARRRGLVESVVGRVVPAVMRSIDTQDLVDALDVNAIAAELDLDALVGELDVDAIAARLDLDALIGRLDVDTIAERLDLDALVDRLDVDAIAARLDVNALMERVDMAQLTAGASQEFAVSGLDLVRRQIIRLDGTVESLIDRTVLRGRPARPDAPPWMDGDETTDDPDDRRSETSFRRNISGHYAGPISRGLAVAADSFGGLAVFGLIASALTGLVTSLTSIDSPIDTGLLGLALASVWMLLWFWIPVALFGRTAGMAVLGLAVIGRDGSTIGRARSLVRALVVPLSMALLFLGFLGALIGRERRTLHDVAAGTIEVYDWGVREAERPATLRQMLSARARRVDVGEA
ncbi:MAG: RDD family protein [Acidimicrobiales bacterium]|nr:RDD family protein [Acidimicrobiales bacterium]